MRICCSPSNLSTYATQFCVLRVARFDLAPASFENCRLQVATRSSLTFTPKRSISRTVMSTYGCETSSSVIRISTPPSPVASGAAMRRAVKYWLLTLPESLTCSHHEATVSTSHLGIKLCHSSHCPSLLHCSVYSTEVVNLRDAPCQKAGRWR
jgi:hypothetical protein